MSTFKMCVCVTAIATMLALPTSANRRLKCPEVEDISTAELRDIRGGVCFTENPPTNCPPNAYAAGSCDDTSCDPALRTCPPPRAFASGGQGSYVAGVTPGVNGLKNVGQGNIQCNNVEICKTACIPGGPTGWKCQHDYTWGIDTVTEYYVHGPNCNGM
jgi:hypothetical protein